MRVPAVQIRPLCPERRECIDRSQPGLVDMSSDSIGPVPQMSRCRNTTGDRRIAPPVALVTHTREFGY